MHQQLLKLLAPTVARHPDLRGCDLPQLARAGADFMVAAEDLLFPSVSYLALRHPWLRLRDRAHVAIRRPDFPVLAC